MAVTNKERIGRMLDLVAAGLRPVIEREFNKALGDEWVSVVLSKREMETGLTGSANLDDPQFLLNALFFNWRETLGRALGVTERNYVGELRDTRNRWAHADGKPFSVDDVYRAYDTAERLLSSVSSPQADELRQGKIAARLEGSEADKKSRERAATAAPVAATPAQGLAPWRTVMLPHQDVAAGRYRQAEFAADLSQVARGEGGPEYRDPREFFARTYMTEGLRLLLVNGLKRLTNTGGESVVDLQTTFGGGKTHSMLALWHVATPGIDASQLPGFERVLEEAAVAALPSIKRAALVGTALSPVTPRFEEGHEIRTLWGELAWRLGGADALATIADADRQGVPPGADALRALLSTYAPVVVLIDEWVTYARLQWGNDTLPGGTFDAALSFAQQLTQAVDQVDGALLVISLPSSLIEIGGEGGQRALESLKQYVHRMDAPWRPAEAQESFEIVRRRLFEPIPPDKVAQRDEVVQHFSELYAQHPGAFPSETREKTYLERLRDCYPIHPELFDRLFEDWSTLERFQRTRGVLKLMAAVVHALWERQDANLLILPAAIPLDDVAVLPQLTQYLDENWMPIIETDVDGPMSLPLRLDRENSGTYGRYSAARRVARSVFLGSAPLPAAANRGIDDKRILLGSVQPGEAPATFGDALRRLAGQATYLYENSGRYWYATQPSINQLARDRADQARGTDRVDEEIDARLKSALADRGPFARVHATPKTASDVPDEDEVAFVVLGPTTPYDSRAASSPAVEAAREILASRGTGDRINENMLVFLAADATRLVELREAVAQFLAWESIRKDGEARIVTLDNFGAEQVNRQKASLDETVRVRIGETYVHLLVPEQSEPLGKQEIRAVKLTPGTDPLAARAGAKLRNEELLITKLGGVNLRLALDGPLGEKWKEQGFIPLRELWEWFSRYLYLPRLRDSSVLELAVRDGASQLVWRTDTFAYAAAKDDAEFRGVVAGKAGDTPITSTSVIVSGNLLTDPLPGTDTLPPPSPPGPTPPAIRRVGRYHGEMRLSQPTMPLPELKKLVDEVITPLASQSGTRIQLRIEIEADNGGDDGFSEQTIRTISENANTLKFESWSGFEKLPPQGPSDEGSP
jgi:predicted AAA+ superfamily ATPase